MEIGRMFERCAAMVGDCPRRMRCFRRKMHFNTMGKNIYLVAHWQFGHRCCSINRCRISPGGCGVKTLRSFNFRPSQRRDSSTGFVKPRSSPRPRCNPGGFVLCRKTRFASNAVFYDNGNVFRTNLGRLRCVLVFLGGVYPGFHVRSGVIRSKYMLRLIVSFVRRTTDSPVCKNLPFLVRVTKTLDTLDVFYRIALGPGVAIFGNILPGSPTTTLAKRQPQKCFRRCSVTRVVAFPQVLRRRDL